MRLNLEKSNRNTGFSKYLSIITPNINRGNSAMKRYRFFDWIKKQDPTICCLQKIYLTTKDTHKLKVKDWKNIYHSCRNQKQAGTAIFMSEKENFKQKLSEEMKIPT
jgi:exonuclease III